MGEEATSDLNRSQYYAGNEDNIIIHKTIFATDSQETYLLLEPYARGKARDKFLSMFFLWKT